MAAMSTFLEDALVNGVLRDIDYVAPTTVYAALFTADGGLEGGTMTNEVPNASAYARTAITFGAPSDGVSSNSVSCDFVQATGSWGTVTHMAIVDSVTWGAGNVLFHGSLTASKTVDNGDTFKFAIGDLEVTLA